MNAKEFFGEFNKMFTGEQREEAVRCYKRNKDYTTFITGQISNILSAEKSHQVSTEYYRVDISAWNNITPLTKSPSTKAFNTYLWNLQAAVEHENNENEWMDEVVKLAHICCPLRVVIGYLPMGANHKEHLDYVAAALQELNCKSNLAVGEFLVIIGNCKTKNQEDYFGYKPYLYCPSIDTPTSTPACFEEQVDWLKTLAI